MNMNYMPEGPQSGLGPDAPPLPLKKIAPEKPVLSHDHAVSDDLSAPTAVPESAAVARARMSEQRRIASEMCEYSCGERAMRKLAGADPERTVTLHIHQLVNAFAAGILTADPWYAGYSIPPKLECVVNHIARCVQVRFPGADVVRIKLGTVERLYRAWTEQHAVMRGWNRQGKPEPTEVLTSRSPIPSARQFIDLDAIYRNAIAILARDSDEAAQAPAEALDSEFSGVRANKPRG
jgi:hypothetical protein